MCDPTPYEFYRPNVEFDGDAYTRSVNAFPCPICLTGHQIPDLMSSVKAEQWVFHCDHCEASGTRKQLNNSTFFAARIPARTCPICGDELHPYAQRMGGDWWMTQSRKWIWRCRWCLFVGTLSDFEVEQAESLVTMPDHESHPTF